MANKVFTDEQKESYLEAVYLGLITTDSLSLDYHEKVGGKLYGAVLDGWGKIGFRDLETEILAGLTNNIYVFSAAKQYQQVRIMSKAITENTTFKEFKELANGIFDDYNEAYLETEFNTAVAQSQSARHYAKIQAEKYDFPLLRYKTQQDGLVRHSHAEINNTVLPVDHPWWNDHDPANDFNCRCYKQQLTEDEAEITKDPIILSEDNLPPLFRMSAGKDKIVFDPKKHPYFSISKGDAQLKRDNFNLPVP